MRVRGARSALPGATASGQTAPHLRPTGQSAAGNQRSAASAIIDVMPVYRPNREEIAREQRLLNDERWQGERDWLRGFLNRMAQASTGDELFAAHVSLVARIRVRQDYIVELRERGTELAHRRSELARVRPKPISQLRGVQAELAEVEWEADLQRALYWLLLDLGDALAWRSLGFDRAAITVLGIALHGSRTAEAGMLRLPPSTTLQPRESTLF